MSARKSTSTLKPPRLSHVCEALGVIAPTRLAQSWDNVGLLAGDVSRVVQRVLLCIDLTPAVVDEAIKRKIDLVVAYHPPIFKPITRLTTHSSGPEAAVFRCITAGIAVYSTHTALDAADGGTNDVIAQLCCIHETHPLQYVYDAGLTQHKLVTFVPRENVEAVSDAMFAAGAGRIGEYHKCSYRLEGSGTFEGSQDTNPTIGRAGRFETVPEVRVEMVCPHRHLPQVVAALIAAHPYEEPAYDIYPLTSPPQRGIGREGVLPRPVSLGQLARKLKKLTHAKCVQIVGDAQQKVARAIIVVGAAGSLPFSIPLTPDDVIITGEIRHHDALTINRLGCTAIALNHWTSERPALAAVGHRLVQLTPKVQVFLSLSDNEPFSPV